MSILFLFKKVKPKIILKTKARQDILERLQGYLDREIQEPIEILSGFWKNQQEAITYQELREAIVNGSINNQTFSMWQQDYSILVGNHMKKWWENSITQGVAGQPISAMLHDRGFRFDGMSNSVLGYIQRHSSDFITNITIGQKDAIKGLLTRAVMEGHSVDELAKVIRPCIGLNDRQSKANLKYYDHVKSSLLKEHPKMKKESAEKKAREAATKYAEKQHRYRAKMIAQTEMAKAYNYGAEEAAVQAYERGLLGKFERIWCTAGNENVCPECNLLNGEKVEKGTIPPLHPFCACALQYVEIEAPKSTPTATPREVEFLEIQDVDRLSETAQGNLERELELIPPQHRGIIASRVNSIQIIQNGNSRYDRELGHLYLRYDFEEGEAIHEFAHVIEEALGIWKGKEFINCIQSTFDGENPLIHWINDDITFVKTIERLDWEEKLLSEYQGRIYEEIGALDENFNFNYFSLGDFFSEAYKFYLISPDLLREKQPIIYEFIKNLIE